MTDHALASGPVSRPISCLWRQRGFAVRQFFKQPRPAPGLNAGHGRRQLVANLRSRSGSGFSPTRSQSISGTHEVRETCHAGSIDLGFDVFPHHDMLSNLAPEHRCHVCG